MDTYIGKIIPKIKDNVESGNFYGLKIDLKDEKPEVLIINDGDDSIKTIEFPYKVNAIALLRNNDELKRLCLAAKGKYVYANSQGEVKEFE